MRPREIKQLTYFLFFPWLVTEFRYFYTAHAGLQDLSPGMVLLKDVFLDGINTWLFFWNLYQDRTPGAFFPESPEPSAISGTQ